MNVKPILSYSKIYRKEKANMSPSTAALTWRVLIGHAATYCKHLEETDHQALVLSAGLHQTGDIKQWATEKIKEILAGAKKLQSVFSQVGDHWSTALSAASQSVERLERAGFQLSNARGAGGLKTDV